MRLRQRWNEALSNWQLASARGLPAERSSWQTHSAAKCQLQTSCLPNADLLSAFSPHYLAIVIAEAAVLGYQTTHAFIPQSQQRVLWPAKSVSNGGAMKDAVDSLPADRPVEAEGFANRKLIRPSLNRADHNHAQASMSEPRERTERPDRPERVIETAPTGPAEAAESPRPRNRPTPRTFTTRSRCSRKPRW